ncbi:MAG: DUF418 domain-containing protein [Hyphomonadaceae bacterium]
MSEIGPIATAARIKSLDVMRGFAVLGILVVNAMYFAAPWQTAQNPLLPPLGIDHSTMWSWFVMHTFFDFKCITLFSLLFGVSLYLVGGDGSDRERGALLRRRLFWLMLFGLLHGTLIWSGDILLHYAIAGFIVMFFRSWNAGLLLFVGGVLYLVMIGLQYFPALIAPYLPPEALAELQAGLDEAKAYVFAPPADELAAVTEAYRGDWASVFKANLDAWVTFFPYGVLGLLPRTIGVMLIGMGLFKIGFLSDRAPTGVYVFFAFVGACAIAAIGYQGWINWRLGFPFAHMQSAGTAVNTTVSILGSIGYAALFTLLARGGVRVITEPLAAVGRMAFTNYIAQSLVMTVIFWGGRGFGLFGEVDRPTLMAIVLAVWALQLIWSPLWLTRFEMGPLEWLWRRLSYGKPVRMAKVAPA